MSRRLPVRLAAVLLGLLLAGGCAADQHPPAGPDVPAVTFVGDSWTAGVGAIETGGFPALTAEELGWQATVLGSSGSGYLRPGRSGPFGTRIDEAVAGSPDVIVVQGSLNDHRADLGALPAAAGDALRRLRDAADPATEIVVLGSSHTPGTDAATIDRINAALAAAAAGAGLVFVDVAAENWTDPADPAVWADPLHPNDAGHARIAERLAKLLADLVGG